MFLKADYEKTLITINIGIYTGMGLEILLLYCLKSISLIQCYLISKYVEIIRALNPHCAGTVLPTIVAHSKDSLPLLLLSFTSSLSLHSLQLIETL